MVVSRHQNAKQNHNLLITSEQRLWKCGKFQVSGNSGNNQNYIHEDIQSTL